MKSFDTNTLTVDKSSDFTATRNACKLCTPLGACVAFKGIEGAIPLIHGSQGCATYIRRYMISHYKEPVDIASSNFSEESTIFGGNKNFCQGIDNIRSQYNPKVITITSTCLSETIGEDVQMLIKEYQHKHKGEELPFFVYASTPSYQGTHADGFHEAVAATVKALAVRNTSNPEKINLFSGFISPEDIRYLKQILTDFNLEFNFLPDYSESLDNPSWDEYKRIPDGGTSIRDIEDTANAKASIELGYIFNKGNLAGKTNNKKLNATAGEYLEQTYGIERYRTGIPIGIKETDRFIEILENISGRPMPEYHQKERGRLVDAYVDGHKYVFGKKAVVYGEEDLVIGLVAFLEEIGIKVVMASSGGNSTKLKAAIEQVLGKETDILVKSDTDFETINELANDLQPDIFIGNSKAYYITRKMGIPLVRVGFPIHDRMGAQRTMHVGYRGTQQLYDRIANAIIEHKQNKSEVGYKYM